MTVFDFDRERERVYTAPTPAQVLLRILCHEHADIPYELRAEAARALAAWNEAERKDNA